MSVRSPPSPTPPSEQARKSSYPLPQGERGRALLSNARRMRREPTDAERALWRVLRARRLCEWKFRRQVRIEPYIVDFMCFSARVIVEADGSQHVESAADQRRDAFLKAQGFRVLRFWNNDVLANREGVLTAILAALETPHPNPSPARGEGLQIDTPIFPSPLAGEDSAACPRSGLAELGEGARPSTALRNRR